MEPILVDLKHPSTFQLENALPAILLLRGVNEFFQCIPAHLISL
jgi:hypothetical protein